MDRSVVRAVLGAAGMGSRHEAAPVQCSTGEECSTRLQGPGDAVTGHSGEHAGIGLGSKGGASNALHISRASEHTGYSMQAGDQLQRPSSVPMPAQQGFRGKEPRLSMGSGMRVMTPAGSTRERAVQPGMLGLVVQGCSSPACVRPGSAASSSGGTAVVSPVRHARTHTVPVKRLTTGQSQPHQGSDMPQAGLPSDIAKCPQTWQNDSNSSPAKVSSMSAATTGKAAGIRTAPSRGHGSRQAQQGSVSASTQLTGGPAGAAPSSRRSGHVLGVGATQQQQQRRGQHQTSRNQGSKQQGSKQDDGRCSSKPSQGVSGNPRRSKAAGAQCSLGVSNPFEAVSDPMASLLLVSPLDPILEASLDTECTRGGSMRDSKACSQQLADQLYAEEAHLGSSGGVLNPDTPCKAQEQRASLRTSVLLSSGAVHRAGLIQQPGGDESPAAGDAADVIATEQHCASPVRGHRTNDYQQRATPAAEAAVPARNGGRLDPSCFHLGRRLGAGSFATVYLARQVDAAGAHCHQTVLPTASHGQEQAGSCPVRFSAQAQQLPAVQHAQQSPVSQQSEQGHGVQAGVGSSVGAGRTAAETPPAAGHVVVVKKLDRTDHSDAQEVMNEIEVMQRAGFHPNLVQFLGWYVDPADSYTCLVMGYCGGGTLAALLKGRPGDGVGEDLNSHFTEQVVMMWFVQLLMALNHLHVRQIIHRDLKPENIFLSKNRKVIKLGDLGIAKQLEGTLELAITCLGTPLYMSVCKPVQNMKHMLACRLLLYFVIDRLSPEVIAARPYTYASDVWSLGCVLYEMAARRPAFEAHGLPQLMFKIMRNAYEPLPTVFSRPFQQLVSCLLRGDPDDRPTTQELLQLPYVRKHLQLLLGRGLPSGRAIRITPLQASSAIKRLQRSSTNRSSSNATAAAAGAGAAGVRVRSPSMQAAGPGARAGTPATQQSHVSRYAPHDGGQMHAQHQPSTHYQAKPGSPSGMAASASCTGSAARGSVSGSVQLSGLVGKSTQPHDAATGLEAGLLSSPAAAHPVAPHRSGSGRGNAVSQAQVPHSKGGGSRQRKRDTAALELSDPANADVQLVRHGKASLQDWDSGGHHEAKLAAQARQRFKARELEQRMTREQVRAWRKERDPAHQARQAELMELQQQLLEHRKQQKVSMAQRAILSELVGEEAAELGTAAAFITRDRLSRTPHLHQDAATSPEDDTNDADESGFSGVHTTGGYESDEELCMLSTAVASVLQGTLHASLEGASMLSTSFDASPEDQPAQEQGDLAAPGTAAAQQFLGSSIEAEDSAGQQQAIVSEVVEELVQDMLDAVTAGVLNSSCHDGGQPPFTIHEAGDDVLYGSALLDPCTNSTISAALDVAKALTQQQCQEQQWQHRHLQQPEGAGVAMTGMGAQSSSVNSGSVAGAMMMCADHGAQVSGATPFGLHQEHQTATEPVDMEPRTGLCALHGTSSGLPAAASLHQLLQQGSCGTSLQGDGIPADAGDRSQNADVVASGHDSSIGTSRPRTAPVLCVNQHGYAWHHVRLPAAGGSTAQGLSAGKVLRSSLQDLQSQLANMWDEAGDDEKRGMLAQVWQLTVQDENAAEGSSSSSSSSSSAVSGHKQHNMQVQARFPVMLNAVVCGSEGRFLVDTSSSGGGASDEAHQQDDDEQEDESSWEEEDQEDGTGGECEDEGQGDYEGQDSEDGEGEGTSEDEEDWEAVGEGNEEGKGGDSWQEWEGDMLAGTTCEEGLYDGGWEGASWADGCKVHEGDVQSVGARSTIFNSEAGALARVPNLIPSSSSTTQAAASPSLGLEIGAIYHPPSSLNAAANLSAPNKLHQAADFEVAVQATQAEQIPDSSQPPLGSVHDWQHCTSSSGRQKLSPLSHRLHSAHSASGPLHMQQPADATVQQQGPGSSDARAGLGIRSSSSHTGVLLTGVGTKVGLPPLPIALEALQRRPSSAADMVLLTRPSQPPARSIDPRAAARASVGGQPTASDSRSQCTAGSIDASAAATAGVLGQPTTACATTSSAVGGITMPGAGVQAGSVRAASSITPGAAGGGQGSGSQQDQQPLRSHSSVPVPAELLSQVAEMKKWRLKHSKH